MPSGYRDRALLALLPPAIAAGCGVLAWLTDFGQSPPERLPYAALAFAGALFGDLLAHALRRQGAAAQASPRHGTAAYAALALGLGLALAALLTTSLPLRYLAAPAAAAALAVALSRLPHRMGAMLGAMSVYTVCTLLANYTLDAFIPVGDWFLVNVGTLFFGVTFTQRDRVHRFGRRAVYLMIVGAAAGNVLAALSVGTPLRYVAVGFLAIVLSESADTEVYQRLLARRWLVRVASSNAVSAPLDTVVFTVLAFAGAPFATFGWMTQVIVTDVIVKYTSGFLTALGLVRARAPVVEALEG